MSKPKAIFQISPLILITLLGFYAAFLRVNSWSPSTSITSLQNGNLSVNDKTQAFQVVNISATEDGLLSIKLKNISSKNISGYKVSIGGNARITKDTTSADRVIAPGEIDELIVPINSRKPSGITILAVVFTDGNIEGEPAAVSELRDWRLGLRLQLTRILPLLQSALDSTETDMPIALDKLKTQISYLQVEPSPALPLAIGGGLHDAKDEFIRKIEEIQLHRNEGNLKLRERLTKLKDRIERRISGP